ncbi:xanthine dehydrogenase accessory protein XdhC [Zavarzinia sp.]|uniref:xanthine dehydrogenase accessory protein XdhC n=1 Tax=Zavarzinia sp. TaxID=2027920 RepID=UPI003563DC46
MSERLAPIARRLAAAGVPAVLVTVREARGSTPRDAGTRMLVDEAAIHGTIGGGRLEWAAIARARAMMASGDTQAIMSLPLGPAVGQCCGGHIVLALIALNPTVIDRLAADEAAEAAGLPTVLMFGAGHVGMALVDALQLLPVRVAWYDQRREAPEQASSEDPLAAIEAAPPGAAVVVATHDHPLDFAITEAALLRPDFAYIGMIGSGTKKARFGRGFLAHGHDAALLERLTCPIGGATVRDKRPAVIAALVAAELLTVLLAQAADD